MRRSALSRNHYFVLGVLLGLGLSFYIPQNVWELMQEECPQQAAEDSFIERFGQDFEPHLNLINKPLAAKKPMKHVIRPRYYSSELGIREKIFIAVMTSQENIDTLATAINRTTAHLVDKIKFFISADNVKNNYKLRNIVGFTDSRENLRPFHVLKYMADNYLDDYDYFLIIPDSVYVDARKLKNMLHHISITFDLYMGTNLENTGAGYYDTGAEAANAYAASNLDSDSRMLSDRNYCDLNAGILLSSSVIRKIRNNLDWCVRNANTNVHSVNIGRCIKYSSKLAGCQQRFQGVQKHSYILQTNTKIFQDLNKLCKDERFRNATTVYPVASADDFYRLHAYYSKDHLRSLRNYGSELERKSYDIANGTISNNVLDIRWPLGVPSGSTPETRHDILTWQLMNRTHIFLANMDSTVEKFRRLDALDFEEVLKITLQYAAEKYPQLEFVDLHTVYRKFDATRGMDYHLHLQFRDSRQPTAALITKSYEVVKPLGRVEVVPSPYVTESTRIVLIVPTFEHQVSDAVNFITQYERVCMRNQDNTFLMMILLYRYDSSSKGESDPFRNVKSLALELSTKYTADGSRIIWVSIRLPAMLSEPTLPDDLMLNSLYARNEILAVAVADLALPKIGLESLVLMASSSMSFKPDFLNRVRMNTIQGFQIYSPIGFMTYPCQLALFCKECDSCDVSQGTGYFDKWNYDVIAFYSRDYVQARKSIDRLFPIIRTDNDIEGLLTRADQPITTVLDMFVASELSVHILRAVEPNLRYGNAIRSHFESSKNIPQCPGQQSPASSGGEAAPGHMGHNNYSNDIPLRYESMRNRNVKNLSNKCIHLASRKQIGDAIIRFEDRGILLK